MDFGRIYEEYFRELQRYLLSLCRDSRIAEELTQETFFRALEHIGQFRGECTLRVWLCQIAKHAWLTHCRRQRRRERSRSSGRRGRRSGWRRRRLP